MSSILATLLYTLNFPGMHYHVNQRKIMLHFFSGLYLELFTILEHHVTNGHATGGVWVFNSAHLYTDLVWHAPCLHAFDYCCLPGKCCLSIYKPKYVLFFSMSFLLFSPSFNLHIKRVLICRLQYLYIPFQDRKRDITKFSYRKGLLGKIG